MLFDWHNLSCDNINIYTITTKYFTSATVLHNSSEFSQEKQTQNCQFSNDFNIYKPFIYTLYFVQSRSFYTAYKNHEVGSLKVKVNKK